MPKMDIESAASGQVINEPEPYVDGVSEIPAGGAFVQPELQVLMGDGSETIPGEHEIGEDYVLLSAARGLNEGRNTRVSSTMNPSRVKDALKPAPNFKDNASVGNAKVVSFGTVRKSTPEEIKEAEDVLKEHNRLKKLAKKQGKQPLL